MESMIITVVIDVLIMTCCIYIATKLVFLDAPFRTLLGIIVAVALISLIPYAGWALSIAVFVLLLMSATGANLLRSLLVVMITRLVALTGVFLMLRMTQA